MMILSFCYFHFESPISHNAPTGRLPFIAAAVTIVTAVLYLLEFCVKQASQALEPHEHLRGLILLIETVAHAFTGAIFWLVASLEMPEPKSLRLMLYSICLACLAAIVVDIDHFIAAGSLSIKVSIGSLLCILLTQTRFIFVNNFQTDA